MKIFYGLVTVLVILMIGASAIKARKKNGQLATIVFLYELGAFAGGVIFFMYTYVSVITLTVLCKGLIMALFDWMLVMLMFYTQHYTGMFKGVTVIKAAFIAYSAFETISFIINTWTRWIFDVTDISHNQITVQFTKGNVIAITHYIYTLGIVLLLLLSYIVMIKRVSTFYRFRYFAILASIFAAFMLDVLTIWSDSIYNMSMLAFGVMSILLYYFPFEYVPNELIENTFSLIIKDMNSGIICFDNAGRCIYCNGIIKGIYGIDDDINVLEKNYAAWLAGQDEHVNRKYQQTIGTGDDWRKYDIAYKSYF